MTPEQLARLSPEQRQRFERAQKIAEEADADQHKLKLIVGALTTMVGRMIDLVPGLAKDPVIEMCIDALGDKPGAMERLADFAQRVVKQAEGG